MHSNLDPHVSHPLSVPSVAGTPRRTLGTLQGPRDHHAPPPAHGVSAHRRSARAPRPSTCGLDRHPRHPAPVAPPSHRPPLDPTRPTTRTPVHRRGMTPTHHLKRAIAQPTQCVLRERNGPTSQLRERRRNSGAERTISLIAAASTRSRELRDWHPATFPSTTSPTPGRSPTTPCGHRQPYVTESPAVEDPLRSLRRDPPQPSTTAHRQSRRTDRPASTNPPPQR